MAMFHFRLQSDKKPSGAKVSAVKHVEYINREETFAHDEQWKEKNKFVGDFITTEEKANVVGGRNALLYKSDDYGSIRNTESGLEVTENASSTTISIALMLADETMEHKPLMITGSAQFRKKVLEATVKANLPISFQNKLMQRELERRRKLIEDERRKFIAGGGRIITQRPNTQPGSAATQAKRIADVTKAGFRLPTTYSANTL